MIWYQSHCLFNLWFLLLFLYFFLVFVSFFCLFACVFVALVTPPPLTRLARPRSERKFSQVFLKAITVQPENLHVPAEPCHRYSRMGMQPGAVSSGFDSAVMMS